MEPEQLPKIRPRALRVLTAYAIEALRNTDFEHVLNLATDEICELLECTHGWVVDAHAGSEMLVRAGIGWEAGVIGAPLDPVDPQRSLVAQVLGGDDPVIVRDYHEDERFVPPAAARAAGIRSSVAAPIPGAAGPFGVIEADSTEPGAFSAHDAEIVRHMGEVIGAAAARAQARADAEEFASLVAHELRSPLTGVIGFSRRLLRALRRDGVIGREAEEDLQLIFNEGQRMRRTVDLLRTLAQVDRTEQPEWEHTAVPLAASAEGVVARARERYPDREYRLSIPAGLALDTDEVALEHVLSNLVENGARYSPPDTAVGLVAHRDGDTAVVSVTDHCGGLTAEDRSQLFRRRYRGSNATQGDGGLGLGLYLASRIARQIGGELEALDRPGPGCEFQLRLPASPVEQANGDGTPRAADAAAPGAR